MTRRQLLISLLETMQTGDLDERAVVRVVFRDAERVVTHVRLAEIRSIGPTADIVVENFSIKEVELRT